MKDFGRRLLVVVPCYNEEGRLDVAAYKLFKHHNGNIDFLFVDDGSNDQTPDILHVLTETDGIYSLRLSRNVGKGEAVRAGVIYALGNDRYDYLGYLDCDLATPLSEIKNMFEYANERGKLLVFGARVKLLGREIEREALRHYLGRLFGTVVSILLGLPVYDTQCGAKIIETDLAGRMFEKAFATRWFFDVELFYRLKMYEEDIVEICAEYPLEKWRGVGASKVTVFDFFLAPFSLLKIHLYYKLIYRR